MCSRRLNRHTGSLRSSKGNSTSTKHGKWGVRAFAREMLGLHTGEPGLARLPMRSVAQAGRRRLRHQNSNLRVVRSQDNTIFSNASEGEAVNGILYQVIDFGVDRSTASSVHSLSHSATHHSSNVGGSGSHGQDGSGGGGGAQDAFAQTLPMTSGTGGTALHPKLTYSKVEEGVALFAAATGFGRAPSGMVIASAMTPLGQIDEGHEVREGEGRGREACACVNRRGG